LSAGRNLGERAGIQTIFVTPRMWNKELPDLLRLSWIYLTAKTAGAGKSGRFSNDLKGRSPGMWLWLFDTLECGGFGRRVVGGYQRLPGLSYELFRNLSSCTPETNSLQCGVHIVSRENREANV
jgi:hypothetical protein